MHLHPPALQCRHQRLDLLRLARHRVPEQEADRRADDQHHEGTQGAHAALAAAGVGGPAAGGAGGALQVVRLEVQVEQRRHPGEQDEHLVEVADRDVPDVGADLVALVPAHHGASERHEHRAPGQQRTDLLGGGLAVALLEEADPVEQRAHEEQRAHPQDRGLAREQVLQQEQLLPGLEVGAEPVGRAAVEADRQEAGQRDGDRQTAQRPPEPAQADHQRRGAGQDTELVAVHVRTVAAEGMAGTGHHQQREDPVERAALREVAAAADRQRGGLGGRGVHALPFGSRLSRSCSNSRSVSSVWRVDDSAVVRRVPPLSGASSSHTHSRRSRT